MIEAKGLNKFFGQIHVIKDLDIKIRQGEIVSIVGPSGAGKSTLLQLLGTIEKADSGTIAYNNQEISAFSTKQLDSFRNTTIGFVFQFHHLLSEFSALENVAMPLLIGKKKKSEAFERSKKLLDLLGLSNRLNHKPNQLSGGEQQRVAVARALANKPRVIYADEPSGNLDTENANELHQLFFDLNQELGQTFVIVTHNKQLAQQSHRTLLMKDGMLIK
ncbi:MAG: lipoprotein-releasing system ATP-binding protein LolD [Bacteroidetes bacterium MED-G17]|nr:MAG: lipoprotein-releasing system ATP-binding protein LolD [Bacteroidetes bacterium MED-G17]|tara:strand:- start:1388 stop:2041 length:654 start_codon:yes stop_codon:yes gene_type:complete